MKTRRIPRDVAEWGLLDLLIKYLDKLEVRVKTDIPKAEYEKSVNDALLEEITRKRQVFRDGMKFIEKKW